MKDLGGFQMEERNRERMKPFLDWIKVATAKMDDDDEEEEDKR